MKDLLGTIRDELKDVHIESGSNVSFDRVCNALNDRLSVSSVYAMGVRDGKEHIREEFRALMGIDISES